MPACSRRPAHAQSVEEFFRNKQISLIVGFPPGGSYDLVRAHRGKLNKLRLGEGGHFAI